MSIKRVERAQERGNTRALCRLLRHRNARIRREAAQALGKLGDAAAVPCLLRASERDADQYVRRWSIQSLQAIDAPEAVDALIVTMFSTRVQDARMAAQSLRQLGNPHAEAALSLHDIVNQHDWDALKQLDDLQKRALAAVLRSEQYASWPSARRRRLLENAVELEITPPAEVSGELADMGLYVSEVHTIVDLLRGLFHRSPDVRIRAAGRLADSESEWAVRLLYIRFGRELRKGGDRRVAAALARAMDRLGDPRAVDGLRESLQASGGQQAQEAAYLLADIGTPHAVEALFDYAVNPPPPPAYRNVPLALSALQGAGEVAVETLAGRVEDESPETRRLMVDVVGRVKHPDRLDTLSRLARDDDPDVSHAALDAMARDNSAEAAAALAALHGDVPDDELARALAAITHPSGGEHLQRLSASATRLYGTALNDGKRPLVGTQVQILEERPAAASDETWQWRAISPRTETGPEGEFYLAFTGWGGETRLQLKLVIPAPEPTLTAEAFTSALLIEPDAAYQVRANIDRFFDRLVVTSEPYRG